MTTTIKAYYDGSGKSHPHNQCRYLTLAGFAGTPEAWAAFEPRWVDVLSRERPGTERCEYFNSSEARTLHGHFSAARGWTPIKVRELRRDLHNDCIALTRAEHPHQFVGASCTVDLDDFRRAVAERPNLPSKYKDPESACVWDVVRVAFGLLVPPEGGVPSKDAEVELYFDRNEEFMKTINRVWVNRRNDPIFRSIVRIRQAIAVKTPALQAADYIAGDAHQAYVLGDEFSEWMVKLPVFRGVVHSFYGYERIARALDRSLAVEGIT
jgi:hypothetical protein